VICLAILSVSRLCRIWCSGSNETMAKEHFPVQDKLNPQSVLLNLSANKHLESISIIT